VQVGNELTSATATTNSARDAYANMGDSSGELHLVAHYEIFISQIIPEIRKKVSECISALREQNLL
jgi:hypothetical protein